MAQKREYTMKEHMLRVRRALREFENCCFCPAAPNFDRRRVPEERWSNDPCTVCHKFVGTYNGPFKCPCFSLGAEEARRKTIRNLHSAGYPI